MPFSLPVNSPAPDTAPGLTSSAPVNAVIGSGIAGGSNVGMTALTQDLHIALFGAGLFMVFQGAKHVAWFDQRKYAHVVLVVVPVVIAIAFTLLVTHADVVDAAARACGVGLQAWLNWVGGKVGGLPGMPAAVTPDP